MTLRDRMPERLRALPARWFAALAGGVVAVVVAAIVLVIGGGGGGGDQVAGPGSEPAGGAHTVTSVGSAPSTSGGPTSGVQRPPTTTGAPGDSYEFDPNTEVPGVVARPIPEDPDDAVPPTTLAPPPWAASTRITEGGHVGVEVGCARDRSVQALDEFLAARVGPVLGWDYQHVYPLGGDRYLWLFQDTFLDHRGVVNTLGDARFVHNAALVQDGACFELLHRGSADRPAPFEEGDGVVDIRTRWFWPLGGELVGDQLWVFWAEMVKDPYDPTPPDGLGWHPNSLFVAAYDAETLAREAFVPAVDPGVTPIYGYAVASDATHTYLFGNTFEQNLVREGGFWNGPHSATNMWLARVPRGQLLAAPEYRTADGWSPARADAVPIVSRFFAENPMQPRFLDGQWVAATDVDGYWGEALAIDVAPDPWGPWTMVEYLDLPPRNADPLMNTYHAHVLPWRDGFGSLIVVISNNARDMLRDAWPRPDRYRPMVIFRPYQATPPTTTTTTTTSTTSTTTSTTTTTTTTTTLPRTTTTTTVPRTTTTTTRPPTTTTTTTTTTTSAPPTTTPASSVPASTVAP